MRTVLVPSNEMLQAIGAVTPQAPRTSDATHKETANILFMQFSSNNLPHKPGRDLPKRAGLSNQYYSGCCCPLQWSRSWMREWLRGRDRKSKVQSLKSKVQGQQG